MVKVNVIIMRTLLYIHLKHGFPRFKIRYRNVNLGVKSAGAQDSRIYTLRIIRRRDYEDPVISTVVQLREEFIDLS